MFLDIVLTEQQWINLPLKVIQYDPEKGVRSRAKGQKVFTRRGDRVRIMPIPVLEIGKHRVFKNPTQPDAAAASFLQPKQEYLIWPVRKVWIRLQALSHSVKDGKNKDMYVIFPEVTS